MTKKLISTVAILSVGVLVAGAILMIGAPTARAIAPGHLGCTSVTGDQGWSGDIDVNGDVSVKSDGGCAPTF